MHARPAGYLVQKVSGLTSKVTIAAKGKEAEANKLIAIMRLGIRHKDIVSFRLEGENEEEESKDLMAFCKDCF